MLKKTNRFLLIILGVGVVFDLLFWKKPVGISFMLFVIVCLASAYGLARLEVIKPAGKANWLIVPLIFFAVMTIVRMEPFTRFVNHTTTLLLMAILATTLVGGRWIRYSFTDYFSEFIKLFANSLALTSVAMSKRNENEKTNGRFNMRVVGSVILGVILALPVLVIFGSLLASADPIFSDTLEEFLEIFDIENLVEFIWRVFLVLVVAYTLGGIFLHGLFHSDNKKLVGEDLPWLRPFLGFIPAGIILGSVVILFASFVVIQFRYFFGGQANIVVNGFTYAEYARQGFFELTWVAVFSLVLFIGLSAITKRNDDNQQKIFSGLGIGLFLLVGVILVSAFQRLLIYEAIFGFSRLRTYSHVFMIWLGILLAGIVTLELRKRQREFVVAVLFAGIGFGVSLNLLNVEGIIVRQNISRIVQGKNLDVPYLASLSVDAVPVLIQLYTGEEDQAESQSNIGAALACHAALNNEYSDDRPWQGFHLARYRAEAGWENISQLEAFEDNLAFENEDNKWVVSLDGEEIECIDYRYYYD